ncbi:MAG: rod shape-determining protein MreD [Planctomycetes bacterium]|nr:rod shape-determining protein MreD [Planctomycetota bacterium]
MRYGSARLLLLALVAFAVETTFAERITFLGGRPEFLLTLGCFAALFSARPGQGFATAWLLGLAKDCGSALPLGLHAFLFLAIAWAIQLLRQAVFREHPLVQCGTVFFAALASSLVTGAFVCLFTGGVPFWTLAGKALAGALLSAAAAPVVMWGLLKWRSYLRPA